MQCPTDFAGSQKAKEADVLGSLFRPSDSPGNDTFQNRSSLIVEKMDFINDDEAHEVGVRSVGRFPRYDIPISWTRAFIGAT